jgi:hypothetical protein
MSPMPDSLNTTDILERLREYDLDEAGLRTQQAMKDAVIGIERFHSACWKTMKEWQHSHDLTPAAQRALLLAVVTELECAEYIDG